MMSQSPGRRRGTRRLRRPCAAGTGQGDGVAPGEGSVTADGVGVAAGDGLPVGVDAAEGAGSVGLGDRVAEGVAEGSVTASGTGWRWGSVSGSG